MDIVRPGETGVLVDEPTVEAVRAGLDRLNAMYAAFGPDHLRAHARRYDRSVFERRFMEVIDRALEKRGGSGAARPRAAERTAEHSSHSSKVEVFS